MSKPLVKPVKPVKPSKLWSPVIFISGRSIKAQIIAEPDSFEPSIDSCSKFLTEESSFFKNENFRENAEKLSKSYFKKADENKRLKLENKKLQERFTVVEDAINTIQKVS